MRAHAEGRVLLGWPVRLPAAAAGMRERELPAVHPQLPGDRQALVGVDKRAVAKGVGVICLTPQSIVVHSGCWAHTCTTVPRWRPKSGPARRETPSAMRSRSRATASSRGLGAVSRPSRCAPDAGLRSHARCRMMPTRLEAAAGRERARPAEVLASRGLAGG